MDYTKLNVTELRGLAKKRGVLGYSRMNKGQLIAVLENPKIDTAPSETFYKYLANEGRWVEVDEDPNIVNVNYPEFNRSFIF